MKKILVLMLCALMVFSSVGVYASFDDIEPATRDWAGEAIDALADTGVINGYPDGTFGPLKNVSRAEFAKMLSVAFELLETDAYYEDILSNWASGYIMSAVSCMYTEGEFFRPNDDASRADIAYAVAKALDLKVSDADSLDKFSDSAEVLEAMAFYITAATENGIILGYDDGTLKPNAPVTRAEAAVIIYRALNKKNTPDTNVPVVPEVNPEKPSAEHIYTLYPCRDLLLIESVSSVLPADGEEAVGISYRIANSEEKYTSVIPADTLVKGLKTSAAQLAPGDVMVMETVFHGSIGCLYVLASFDGAVPAFDTALTAFGDYTTAFGRITNIEKSSKAFTLTLDNGTATTTEVVLKSIPANVYTNRNNNKSWSLDGMSFIDNLTDDIYVFIRYTDGGATEVAATSITR